MALIYPNKKKPLNVAVPAIASPLGALLQPDTAAKPAPVAAPVTAYGAGQSARQGIGAVVNTAANVGSAIAAPNSNFLRRGGEFGRGLFGAEQTPAAALPAPPVAKPPVTAAPAPVIPVRPSASPASQAGASAPAGGGAAPFAGQYNAGGGATYATGDGRQGQLPAGVAVVRQKNGVNAFGATGASVAAATGQPQQQQVASAPLAMPTNLNVPGISLPSANTSRVSDAERERAALAKQIGDQADLMNFQGLDTRGKRDLYASLLREQSGLTQQAGSLAGSAAGQELGAATQAGTSTQAQVGENARAALNEAGANQRNQLTEQGANVRALLDLQKPQTITDANGNLIQVTGSKAQPVTGPDGQPIRGPRTAAEGSITPAVSANLLVEQLKAEQGAITPNPSRIANLQAQLQQLQSGNAGGNVAVSKPSLQQFMAAAKARNPGTSDAELQAYYTKTYGGK